MLSLSDSHQVDVIEAFNSSSRHLDDLPPVASAALRSKAVVLVLLVHFFIVAPIVCGGSVFAPFLLRSLWFPF